MMEGSSCREDEQPKKTKLKLDSDLYCRGWQEERGCCKIIDQWVGFLSD